VITRRVPGLTATSDGSVIHLESNRGVAAGAAVAITGGTLVTNRAFDVASDTGVARDYVLDRPRGDVRLAAPLAAGDRLSVGTTAPRPFLESTAIPPTTLAADAHAWVAPDGGGAVVATGVTTTTPISTSIVGVHDWGNRLRIEAFAGATPTSSVFENVRPGDTVIPWDPAFPASLRDSWRVANTGTVTVSSVTYRTRLDLERRAARAQRAGHAAVALLPSGAATSKVLVTGGALGPTAVQTTPVAITNSVEIYDPATQLWTPAAPMATARAYHTATALADGRVLVVGGVGADGAAVATTELYTPGTDTWAAGPAYQVATAYHRATRLQDNTVLVTGGRSGTTYRTNAAIFTPGADTWGANVPMTTARAQHGAVLFPDGRVFVAGGETTGGGATTTTERFTGPATWAAGAALPAGRKGHGLAAVGASPTTVVAVGGSGSGGSSTTYAVYTIASNTWGADTALGMTFVNKDVIRIDNGNVLALFGETGGAPISRRWNGSSWTTVSNPMYADAPSRDEVACVLLYDLPAASQNKVLTVGGYDTLRRMPTAAVELYDGAGDVWSRPEAAIVTNVLLGSAGLSVARSVPLVQREVVPAGVNHSAASFAAALAARGVTASTFRTNRLRLRTNRHADGDLLLAAVDAAGLGLAPAAAAPAPAHVGAAESGPDRGTPDFRPDRVLEDAKPVANAAAVVRISRPAAPAGSTLVLARDQADGTPSVPRARWGRSEGFATTVASAVNETDATKMTPRNAPPGGFAPNDRAWLASPYGFGPGDDLVVVVDRDEETRRFDVPLFRRGRPVAGTYGAQVEISDGDAGGASLAAAFGLDYSFNDYAVWMRARAKAFSSNAARSMLVRYYLHGPVGQRARARFAYPLAASAPIAIAVDAATNTTVDVRVRLAGGTARTLNSLRDSTRLGTACPATSNGLGSVVVVANLAVVSASRDGANLTTLTLTLPAGVTDCGFVTGNNLYFASTNGNWTSGTFTITTVGAPGGPTQTVTFTNTALGAGAVGAQASPGTVSYDAAEVTFNGAAVVAGDFLRLNAASGIPAAYTGETFRVTTATANHLFAAAVEKTFGSPDTTLSWDPLGTAAYISIFSNPGQTAAAVVAAVNALGGAVTLTALGNGTGPVAIGTVEDAGDASAWLTLTDGINWVGRTINPAVVGDNYQFVLKVATDAALATGSDWANEDVRLVPTTAANAVAWLNAPPVSGLFTAADVELVDGGARAQIATRTPGTAGAVEIQGGLANAATAVLVGGATDVGAETVVVAPAAGAAGLAAGAWVEARNSLPAHRVGIHTAATVLSSWTTDGYLTTTTPVYTQRFSHSTARLHVERQGRYVAISDPPGVNTNGVVTFAGLLEGDYVRLAAAAAPTSYAQGSVANQGIFRVVRVAAGDVFGAGGTVWIENTDAVAETAEFRVQGLAYDSVLPGDVISIGHDVWNHANRGDWVVELVGAAAGTTAPYVTTTVLKVGTATRTPAPVSGAPALGTAGAAATLVAEGTPGKLLKRVVALSPNAAAGYVDVRLDSAAGSRLLAASLGTVLYGMDRLAFPTGVRPGHDGYRASVGLVGAVNRVLYGDPTDPATYPGVVAEGAVVLVGGPTVRRVGVSLLIRALTTFQRSDVAARVRAAVAAVINRAGAGESIAISAIVAAAKAVQGVSSVTVLAPTYDASHDRVEVAATEKARVLDPERDVTISFVAS
jgi:hypothetical protein